MPHRLKGGALVALFKDMRPGNPGHQRHSQGDDVLFPIGKGIAGARRRASGKPRSRKKCVSPVSSASNLLYWMTASTGSQQGSFGKGGPQLREAPYELTAQRLVIHLALDRTCAQRLLPSGRLAPRSGEAASCSNVSMSPM